MLSSSTKNVHRTCSPIFIDHNTRHHGRNALGHLIGSPADAIDSQVRPGIALASQFRAIRQFRNINRLDDLFHQSLLIRRRRHKQTVGSNVGHDLQLRIRRDRGWSGTWTWRAASIAARSRADIGNSLTHPKLT